MFDFIYKGLYLEKESWSSGNEKIPAQIVVGETELNFTFQVISHIKKALCQNILIKTGTVLVFT